MGQRYREHQSLGQTCKRRYKYSKNNVENRHGWLARTNNVEKRHGWLARTGTKTIIYSILYGIWFFFWHISSINTPVGLPVSVTRLILIGLLSGAQAETKGSTSRIYSYTFGKSSCT
ncbi:hypothetical protein L1887_37790 [Cichorium endivia]|nr:hypothetical protein L1887_37790 [Cichorium endivia]